MVRVQDLIDFLDASPSPWHAAQTAATLLDAAGFTELNETDAWTQTIAASAAGFIRAAARSSPGAWPTARRHR